MFHPQDAVVAFSVDVFEDIPVIDFTRRWLFAPWVVTDLEITDLVPCSIDVGNQVSLGNLLMIDIVYNLYHTNCI